MRGLVAALAVAGLSAAAAVEAQGLGDAAKREKARRTQDATSTKPKAATYTNDDIVGKGGGQAQFGGEAPADAEAGVEAAASSASAPAPVLATGSIGPAPESSGSGGSGRGGHGESYWRSRAQSSRVRVEAAEKRVADLEAQAARNGPVTPGPTGPACQDGVLVPTSGVSPIELRDAAKGAKTCDAETLRQQRGRSLVGQLDASRQELASARKALDDLDDEARRDGALPGWLR